MNGDPVSARLVVYLHTGGTAVAWPHDDGTPGRFRVECSTAHRRLHRIADRDGWGCRYCGALTLDMSAIGWRIQSRSATRRALGAAPELAPDGDEQRLLLATLDHVVPKARGGTDAMQNLAVACWLCNNKKADRNLGTWRPAPQATRRLNAL